MPKTMKFNIDKIKTIYKNLTIRACEKNTILKITNIRLLKNDSHNIMFNCDIPKQIRAFLLSTSENYPIIVYCDDNGNIQNSLVHKILMFDRTRVLENKFKEKEENLWFSIDNILSYLKNRDPVDIYGYTPLMIAAKKGYYFILNMLIKHGSNINLRSYSGESLLSLAVKNGNVKIINFLLKFIFLNNNVHEKIQYNFYKELFNIKENLNINNDLSLIKICNKYYCKYQKYDKDNLNISPIYILKLLLKHKLDVNFINEYEMDIDRYCIKCKKYNSYYNYSNNLPEYCVICKETDMIDVTKCSKCKIRVASYNTLGLIPQYCYICKKDNMYNVTDRMICTESPLLCAIKRKNVEMIEILLKEKNININIQDYQGLTPINMTCLEPSNEDNQRIIKLLLKNKNINVNIPDKYNITPYERVFKYTILNSNYFSIKKELLNLLKKKGANTTISDIDCNCNEYKKCCKCNHWRSNYNNPIDNLKKMGYYFK